MFLFIFWVTGEERFGAKEEFFDEAVIKYDTGDDGDDETGDTSPDVI